MGMVEGGGEAQGLRLMGDILCLPYCAHQGVYVLRVPWRHLLTTHLRISLHILEAWIYRREDVKRKDLGAEIMNSIRRPASDQTNDTLSILTAF